MQWALCKELRVKVILSTIQNDKFGLNDSSKKWIKINNEKQQQYLQTRVRIQLHERFEYTKPENFKGYILKSIDE